VGIGLADLIHERLYQKIDFGKTYLNSRVSLNPVPAKLPIHLSSDQEALDLALGHLGRPEPDEQRVVWIRNTLSLNCMVISAPLTHDAGKLAGWRLSSEEMRPHFDAHGDIASVL